MSLRANSPITTTGIMIKTAKIGLNILALRVELNYCDVYEFFSF